MKTKKIFSNKLVYVASLMLTIFSIFIYSTGLFVRISEGVLSVLGFIFIALILILALLQVYFLLIKNKKNILLTNVHLIILICFTLYGLMDELITYRYYTRDVNGMVFIIIILLISLFIVNKYKIREVKYENIESIGTHND
jgi:hypothetical protein